MDCNDRRCLWLSHAVMQCDMVFCGVGLCFFLVELDSAERIVGAVLQQAFHASAQAPED